MSVLASRDNPRVKRWTKLARESRLRRSEGRAIIEGPHLLEMLLAQKLKPVSLIATPAALAQPAMRALVEASGVAPVVVAESVFRAIGDAESPQGIAAEIAIPALRREGDWVFLEGVQDAGNVGAIVRSAAAFGAGAVILDRGCADPWSPKALRAGMGGHFLLQVLQVDALGPALEGFAGRRVCTVARGGAPLRDADLSGKLAWLFGSEARGVSAELQAKADLRVTIPLAAGTESLNVAAAAAICFYESFSRPGGRS